MTKELSELFTWRTAIVRSDLSSTTKLVGLCLSLYMSERGDSAFPAVATLAKDASLTDRAVREHLRVLEEREYLRTDHQRGKSSRYYAQTPEPRSAPEVSQPRNHVPPPPEPRSGVPRNHVPPKSSGITTSGTTEVQELSASGASNATTQAQLWDAVRTACGWPGRDLLSPAKTRLGKAARILREGGATVEDVSDFAAAYRAAWPGMSLTPEAMVKHWDLWRGGGFRPQIVSKPVTAADRVFGTARAWEARHGSDEGGTVRRDAGGGVPALPDRGADHPALGAGLREARRGDRVDRMGGASPDEGSER